MRGADPHLENITQARLGERQIAWLALGLWRREARNHFDGVPNDDFQPTNHDNPRTMRPIAEALFDEIALGRADVRLLMLSLAAALVSESDLAGLVQARRAYP